ncbi:MAG: hypothetical protein GMKNLPBB_00884 [Myxococcota bacterium]|nr:hypothetical protein [Myxococcota bacterium]
MKSSLESLSPRRARAPVCILLLCGAMAALAASCGKCGGGKDPNTDSGAGEPGFSLQGPMSPAYMTSNAGDPSAAAELVPARVDGALLIPNPAMAVEKLRQSIGGVSNPGTRLMIMRAIEGLELDLKIHFSKAKGWRDIGLDPMKPAAIAWRNHEETKPIEPATAPTVLQPESEEDTPPAAENRGEWMLAVHRLADKSAWVPLKDLFMRVDPLAALETKRDSDGFEYIEAFQDLPDTADQTIAVAAELRGQVLAASNLPLLKELVRLTRDKSLGMDPAFREAAPKIRSGHLQLYGSPQQNLAALPGGTGMTMSPSPLSAFGQVISGFTFDAQGIAYSAFFTLTGKDKELYSGVSGYDPPPWDRLARNSIGAIRISMDPATLGPLLSGQSATPFGDLLSNSRLQQKGDPKEVGKVFARLLKGHFLFAFFPSRPSQLGAAIALAGQDPSGLGDMVFAIQITNKKEVEEVIDAQLPQARKEIKELEERSFNGERIWSGALTSADIVFGFVRDEVRLAIGRNRNRLRALYFETGESPPQTSAAKTDVIPLAPWPDYARRRMRQKPGRVVFVNMEGLAGVLRSFELDKPQGNFVQQGVLSAVLGLVESMNYLFAYNEPLGGGAYVEGEVSFKPVPPAGAGSATPAAAAAPGAASPPALAQPE